MNFIFPIAIPIGLAILTAQIALIAKKAKRRGKMLQGEGDIMGRNIFESGSNCEVFEYKWPLWHEFSMSIGYAYISYDIWAYTTLAEHSSCSNIITIKICTYLITIFLLLHFIYLLYRAQNGTESLNNFRRSILLKRLIVWLNLISFLSLFVVSGFLAF